MPQHRLNHRRPRGNGQEQNAVEPGLRENDRVSLATETLAEVALDKAGVLQSTRSRAWTSRPKSSACSTPTRAAPAVSPG